MPVITFERHLGPEDLVEALRSDVATGLTSKPKELPPKWFYDARGSALFEDITGLEEYYLTRAERQILSDRAGEIASVTGAATLVELGSGSSEKTGLLLGSLDAAETLRSYVPVDVSGAALEDAATRIAANYPRLELHGVVADFERQLDTLPDRHDVPGARLVALLGSTIGNFPPRARARFLAAVRVTMSDGDTFLLGTDLVKDPDRLLSAYDDAQGVTAAFNRNVLCVINRALGGDFDPERFDHVAVWDPVNEWIEMRLRSRRRTRVRIEALDLTVAFDAGEQLRTEISAKFRPERVTNELAAAGFDLIRWWTDAPGDFAVSLWAPRPDRNC